jgi:hypothetical protein
MNAPLNQCRDSVHAAHGQSACGGVQQLMEVAEALLG